jgi:hypothetical protein
MVVLINFGITAPLWRAQIWALERGISFDCVFGDLSWTAVALISRSLDAAWNALVRSVAGRAWKGARFTEDITAAATMVAAACR